MPHSSQQRVSSPVTPTKYDRQRQRHRHCRQPLKRRRLHRFPCQRHTPSVQSCTQTHSNEEEFNFRTTKNSSQHLHTTNIKWWRDSCQSGDGKKKASIAISDVTAVDDIFYNILSFFVQSSDSGSVGSATGKGRSTRPNDVRSFHSIMCVSKQWYSLSTSSRFWLSLLSPGFGHDETKTSLSVSLLSSRDDIDIDVDNDIDATLDHALIGFTKLSTIDSMRRSCSRHVADWRTTTKRINDCKDYTDCKGSHQQDRHRIEGLGRFHHKCCDEEVITSKYKDEGKGKVRNESKSESKHACESQSKSERKGKIKSKGDAKEIQSYKVQERATRKRYILKISNKCCNQDGTHSPSHLREIVASQRLRHFHCSNGKMSAHSLAQDCRGKECFSVLHDWKARQSNTNNLLCLYEDSDDMISLHEFMKASEHVCEKLSSREWALFKGILHQVLRSVIEMHQCGLAHCNLRSNNIFIAREGREKRDPAAGCNTDASNDIQIPCSHDRICTTDVRIKIGNFSTCRGFSSSKSQCIVATQGLRAQRDKNEATVIHAVEDFHAIGRIFLSMLTYMMDANDPGSGAWVRNELYASCETPSFADVGVNEAKMTSSVSQNDKDYMKYTQAFDFIKRLLCLSCNNYSTVLALVKHPFFSATNDSLDDVMSDIMEGRWLESERREQLQRLKMMESSMMPLDEHRAHLASEERAAIVDWLFEIVSVFDKSTRSVFIAMAYLDKAISRSGESVRRDQLQLLAATCLHIASKVEDNLPLDVTNLYYSADRTFQKEDIVEVEVRILQHLDWHLWSATVHDFVGLYNEYLGIGDNTYFWLSQYLSELALQSNLHLKYPSSLVGAAVVVLSRYWAGMTALCPVELESVSGYLFCELGECIVSLALHSNGGNPDLKVIPNRYMKSCRGSVASLECPLPDLEMMKSK